VPRGPTQAREIYSPCVQEKFHVATIQQAISHLVQPGASPKDRASIRVALLTCVVSHLLRTSPRTLPDSSSPSRKWVEAPARDGSQWHFFTDDYGQSTDESIVEAFSRIYSQVQLLIPTQKPRICLPIPKTELPTPISSPSIKRDNICIYC